MTATSGKLILKKYGNRRLYDTTRSKYITLNEVSDMIKHGAEVEVVDANTKEDVTAYILTQIILEQARNKNVLLPVSLLHLIIRYGENLLHEFFEKYLHQIIDNYIQFKNVADEQFSKWIDMQLDYTNIARKTFSDMSSFRSFFGGASDEKSEKDKDKK